MTTITTDEGEGTTAETIVCFTIGAALGTLIGVAIVKTQNKRFERMYEKKYGYKPEPR